MGGAGAMSSTDHPDDPLASLAGRVEELEANLEDAAHAMRVTRDKLARLEGACNEAMEKLEHRLNRLVMNKRDKLKEP